MRITLVFSSQAGARVSKGPFKSFCLQGETLRETVGGPVIAAHEGHEWHVDDQRYARVDCDCHVTLQTSRIDGKTTKQFGPFGSFSCYDGIAYADHAVFAFADRSIGDWYCHADGRHWAIIQVDPVD